MIYENSLFIAFITSYKLFCRRVYY